MTNMVNMTNSQGGKRAVKATRINRVVVMLTDKEVEAIENHRFSNRISTSSETIRTLIKKGLGNNLTAPQMKTATD